MLSKKQRETYSKRRALRKQISEFMGERDNDAAKLNLANIKRTAVELTEIDRAEVNTADIQRIEL